MITSLKNTIPAVPPISNKVGNKNYELTNHLGNVNVVINDRKMISLTGSNYEAVVIMKADYYPFGMEMPGRTSNTPAYRFGYNGMEKDDKVNGSGNTYDYGYREYDPRIGRWSSGDPLRDNYPGMSPYNYAGNSPIACKDPNGQFIIFINGFTGKWWPGECEPYTAYWSEKGSQFIDAAKRYFNDDHDYYRDGSGSSVLSTASDRREEGMMQARSDVEGIRKLLKDYGSEESIEIVTHSMGAAYGEGYIEELMNYPDIAKRIKEVVHFSPCDADQIKISKKSKKIKRSQINILSDQTLGWADWGGEFSGGYRIKGIKRFKLINVSLAEAHPNYKPKYFWESWDFHYDTKTYGYVWDYVHELNNPVKKQSTFDFEMLNNPFRTGDLFKIDSKNIETPIYDDGIFDENDKAPGNVG